MSKHTEEFQTEVSELLQLIIHSLYSHPEIFLRELISNSSDALDKLKLEGLTNSALIPEQHTPEIWLKTDKEARTLTIRDNGIGMTEAELRENLGTIAHSGTKAFLARRKEIEDNPELIGQFGVGFYSAFMVADKVRVETQKAGEKKGLAWESDGKGSYSIEECERSAGTGTSVILHLKEKSEETDLPDFLEEWVLRSTVKKHSDFIAYPIKMMIERSKSEDEKEGSSEAEIVSY